MNEPVSDRMSFSAAAEMPAERGRDTYQLILLLSAVTLLLLPFITTFNEFMTAMVMTMHLDGVLREWIVPAEARMVAVLLSPLGVDVSVSSTSIYIGGGDFPLPVFISWNCVGWQSLILFALTVKTGLEGRYTRASQLRALSLGLLGIVWINLLRIAGIALMAYYFGRLPAVLAHDYGGTVMTIVWLALFWYFAINYVLEPKDDEEEEAIEER
jgi:exosortase/archaeosortase family protein